MVKEDQHGMMALSLIAKICYAEKRIIFPTSCTNIFLEMILVDRQQAPQLILLVLELLLHNTHSAFKHV